MNTKELTKSAIFLAIGTILHYIVPGLVGGMKPDFLLLMMFLAILLNTKLKSALTVSILGGIIAALTTTFPGGQIPSVLDKLISGLFVYFIASLLTSNNKLSSIAVTILTALGTLVSGIIFAGTAAIIVGLPQGLSFTALIATVVIPTTLITGFFSGILYSVLRRAKRTLK